MALNNDTFYYVLIVAQTFPPLTSDCQQRALRHADQKAQLPKTQPSLCATETKTFGDTSF